MSENKNVCDYCKNVGACPKCWGRGGINQLKAEKELLLQALASGSIDRPRNIVLCKGCLDVLESKHRHDFVQCKCENRTFTDGGTDYQRIGGADLKLVEVIERPK